MKPTTDAERMVNQLCGMEAEVNKMMETAIQAGQYQLAFCSLRALKTFINIAKQAAIDVAFEREETCLPY